MAIILHPKRWTSQPSLGAQINFGHPLVKGLTFYSLYNAGAGLQKTLLPINLAETTVGTVPSPNWISGGDVVTGKSHNWNGNWSGIYQRGPWVEPNWMTGVARVRRTGTLAQYAAPFCKTWGNNTSPFDSWNPTYNPAGAGQDVLEASFTNQAGVRLVSSNVSIPGGSAKPHTVGITVGPSGSNGVLGIWVNGIQLLSQSQSATGIGYDQTATGNLIISGSAANAASQAWIGQISYVAIWNRPLTASEMEWLHVEPYALLTPKRTIRYSIPSAASRTYSYWITLERLR